jgi:hypothetical protein
MASLSSKEIADNFWQYIGKTELYQRLQIDDGLRRWCRTT